MLLLILAMMIKERNGFAPNLLAYMMEENVWPELGFKDCDDFVARCHVSQSLKDEASAWKVGLEAARRYRDMEDDLPPDDPTKQQVNAFLRQMDA